ncbi:MAG: hypothetical protein ACOY5C_10415 [Pseudomonadota bacterium]
MSDPFLGHSGDRPLEILADFTLKVGKEVTAVIADILRLAVVLRGRVCTTQVKIVAIRRDTGTLRLEDYVLKNRAIERPAARVDQKGQEEEQSGIVGYACHLFSLP